MNITVASSIHMDTHSTSQNEKLQNKSSGGKVEVKSSNLSRLQSILDKSPSTTLPALGLKKVSIEEFCQKIEKPLLGILFQRLYQRWVPSQIDMKNFSEIFAKLFAHLSVEMYKLEGVDKKLARQKRFLKKVVEKSAESKKTGK